MSVFSTIRELFISGDNRTKAVRLNSIYSVIIKGVSVLITFALVPLTIGYVSSELYGIWLTLSSIIHWMNYFDVGFSLGLRNKLVDALAADDMPKAKAYVSTTYVLMALIFFPLGILLFLLAPAIDWCSLLKVSAEHNLTIVKAVQLLVAFNSVQMTVNTLSAVVAAHQKVALSSLFGVIGQFISLIVIFVLTKTTQSSLIILCAVFAGAPLITYLISSVILYYGNLRNVRPATRSVDFSLIKDLWSLGWKFFVIQIQLVVMYQMTNLLISNISGPESVTEFNVAYKYLSLGLMLMTILVGPLWPAFADAYVKKDYEWMKSTYKKFIKIFLLLSIAQCVLLAVSGWFYRLWVGDEVPVSFILSASLSVYLLAYMFVTMHTYMLNGIGSLNLQVWMYLIGGVIHIPLSLFLGRYLGALSVVVSLCSIHLVYCFLVRRQMSLLLSDKAYGFWAK